MVIIFYPGRSIFWRKKSWNILHLLCKVHCVSTRSACYYPWFT